ncbi:DUF3325 family protein [Gluconobacter japonicus]|uniref:DUF3325 family protein n=1 Tax=Gluconobacter japonicus TaxID=376620 RepID=UPI00029A937A|nr:DUF3325 family protein [Gluconobacter japonicus]GAP24606.1 hypothetical protein GLF_1488 [Gluconobacter frateurii NBRC 101659]
MTGPSFLCGQFAMLLLAAGSARGSGIFFRKSPPASYRLGLQISGFALLVLSLLLKFYNNDFPIVAMTTWIGLLSLEVLLAALICTALNARKRSSR